MTDHLPATARGLPHVIIAQRVIDKIVRGALLYPGYETGEAMVGLIVQDNERLEPDIYILDTINPGEDVVRQWGKFEQGSDWQGDVMHWLHINWEAFRDLHHPPGHEADAKWDMPLRFVGDWHKQPGTMIAPSGGDLQTACAMLADPETPDQQLVAPIITMYRVQDDEDEDLDADANTDEPEASGIIKLIEMVESSEREAAQTGDTEVKSESIPAALTPDDVVETSALANSTLENVVDGVENDLDEEAPSMTDPESLPANALVRPSEDEKWVIRIDFWYISQRLMRNFTPVSPIIWPDDQLPNLPQVAWHLTHSRRFDQEVKLLADAGYAVDVVRWDADGKPPYEICFSIYKPGATNVFILVTPVDYPIEMPAMRIAPLVRVEENEDVFEKLYDVSEPLLLTKLPDWPWDSKRTIIELVWHIEKTLGEGDKV